MINIKYMINKLKEINDKQRELSFDIKNETADDIHSILRIKKDVL